MKEKIFLILILLMILTGCGSSSANSPSQIVKKFYSHLENNETSKAREFLSQRVTIVLSGLQLFTDAQTNLVLVSRVKSSVVKNDTVYALDLMSMSMQTHIKDVAITKEEINGESAIVDFKVSYTEGFNLNFKNFLIKEGGRWKVDQFSSPILVQ